MASGYGAIITLGVELLKWMNKGGGSGSGTDPLLAALQRIDARESNSMPCAMSMTRRPTEETSAQPLGERPDPGDEPVEEHAGVDVNTDARVGLSSPAVTPVSDRHASR